MKLFLLYLLIFFCGNAITRIYSSIFAYQIYIFLWCTVPGIIECRRPQITSLAKYEPPQYIVIAISTYCPHYNSKRLGCRIIYVISTLLRQLQRPQDTTQTSGILLELHPL
ncbi:12638_t:CDS:2, partial [Dentiscutata erythropus]